MILGTMPASAMIIALQPRGIVRSIRLGGALLAIVACGDPPERGADDRATAGAPGSGVTATPPGESASTAPRPHSDPVGPTGGLVFDPAAIREGDTVGDFRVARVDVTDAGGDMGLVGTARFIGEMIISGHKRPHPDYPDVTTLCMDVDSASAARLPRWPGDARTQRWLCFENQEAAIRMLGPAGTREPIRILIDTFQTPRQFSDVYDTARLVRVVEPPS